MVVEHGGIFPDPFRTEDSGLEILALGSPIFRERIDLEQTARDLLKSTDRSAFVRNLNGSFLFFVFDRPQQVLTIFNDRFASIPLYYGKDGQGQFVASMIYTDLWRRLKESSGFSRADLGFFQLIHFQRLYSDTTYDTESRCMDSGSELTYEIASNQVKISKYWTPEFDTGGSIDPREHAERLANTLKQSVARRMSDDHRYGILLSGGLDSRMVLAAADKEMACFTFADSNNNEVGVAARVAAVRGFDHTFIERDPDHYSLILDEAVNLGGAMNVFDHAHALHLGDRITPGADVILHGHGIDPFFQGTYLPVQRVKWLGKSTFIRKLQPLEENMAAQYVANIKHRLKSISSLEIVRKEKRAYMTDYLVESVQEVMTEGERYADDPYDVWEFVYYQNLSRAFSNLNLLSVRTFAEERSVSYDNDLYDLYLQTPVKHRISGDIHTRALSILNRQLAEIVNANTNLPANWGATRASFQNFIYKALRKSGLNRSVPAPPGIADRSWPDRNEIFRQRPQMAALADAVRSSEALASIDYIDMDSVGQLVTDHIDGRGNYGDLLFGLITIDRFLSMN